MSDKQNEKKTTLSQYNPDHDQLESMDTHKNVADMAASKFKNMLNRFYKMIIMQKSEILFSPQTSPTNILTILIRELSVLSESKDGAMIADHIKDVYYDRTQVQLIFKEEQHHD